MSERVVKTNRQQQITRFVQTGACLYKDNWCSGGHIGGKTEFDKEPCSFYQGGRCVHPKHPDRQDKKECAE